MPMKTVPMKTASTSPLMARKARRGSAAQPPGGDESRIAAGKLGEQPPARGSVSHGPTSMMPRAMAANTTKTL